MFHLPTDHPQHDPVMELAMVLSFTHHTLGDLAEDLEGATLEQVWIWLDELQDVGVPTIRSIDYHERARTLVWLHPLSFERVRPHANAYWRLGADPDPMDGPPGDDREPSAALAVAEQGR